MVLITATAQAQLEALERHYSALGRDIATIRMTEAVMAASVRIERRAGPFWPAPHPYPDLAELGWQWLKQGRYWVAYTQVTGDYAITGIFFETANIPGRALPSGPSP